MTKDEIEFEDEIPEVAEEVAKEGVLPPGRSAPAPDRLRETLARGSGFAIPTITVWRRENGAETVINAIDFDPALHSKTRPRVRPKAPPTGPPVGGVKPLAITEAEVAALTLDALRAHPAVAASGIKFSSKEELLAQIAG